MRIFMIGLGLAFSLFNANAKADITVSCETPQVPGYKFTVTRSNNEYLATYYRIQLVNAQRQYTRFAQADNVNVSTDAGGNVVYTTDGGFRLQVNGSKGSFSGEMPVPPYIFRFSELVCSPIID